MTNYPTIGIRPIIDGRRFGVRESLEEKTMQMAKMAKELIESEIRYPDGTPMKCVISDCTIGGGEEAARCAQQFATQNVCATLSVTPCWCYGSETMDLDPSTIKAVWGFNGTERPGAVYLAAVMAAHNQRGLPAFSIYGHDVQDVTDSTIPCDVKEKNSPVRPLRLRCRRDEEQSLCGHRLRFHGHHGLFLQSSVLPGLPGHPRRVGRYDRGAPPHEAGDLRSRGI